MPSGPDQHIAGLAPIFAYDTSASSSNDRDSPGMKRLPNAVRNAIAIFETKALVLWLALVALVWLFFRVASEVSEKETDALDNKILFLLRAPGNPSVPVGPLWLQEAMRDITALGGFTLLTIIVIAAVTALLLHKRRLPAAVLTATVILAHLSSDVLKIFYDRARPDAALHAVRVYSQSFPSGHATMAATTFLTLAVIVSTLETSRRDKLVAFALAAAATIAVGFSRVYLGVHWPSDVLAGWIAGGSWALGAHIALKLGSGAPTT